MELQYGRFYPTIHTVVSHLHFDFVPTAFHTVFHFYISFLATTFYLPSFYSISIFFCIYSSLYIYRTFRPISTFPFVSKTFTSHQHFISIQHFLSDLKRCTSRPVFQFTSKTSPRTSLAWKFHQVRSVQKNQQKMDRDNVTSSMFRIQMIYEGVKKNNYLQIAECCTWTNDSVFRRCYGNENDNVNNYFLRSSRFSGEGVERKIMLVYRACLLSCLRTDPTFEHQQNLMPCTLFLLVRRHRGNICGRQRYVFRARLRTASFGRSDLISAPLHFNLTPLQ